MTEEKLKFSGKPLSEEEYKEWEQAFIDIEESIAGLEKDNETEA